MPSPTSKPPKRRGPPPSQCREDPEIDAGFGAIAKRLSAVVLDLVPLVRKAEEIGHWREQGAASLVEFAEIHGVSSHAALAARTLVRVFEKEPGLEEVIRAGSQPYDTVAALLPFLEDPTLLEPGESFGRLLEANCASALRRLARQRRLARKKDDPERRTTVAVELSEKELEDLDRVREIESQRLQREVGAGEALGGLLRDFVARKDPGEKALPRRRMADTAGRPGRATAARTKAWLVQAYGNRCPIDKCPFCLFRERAHLTAKKDGGDQEAPNLFPPCPGHHTHFDTGRLFLRVVDGRRLIVNKHGRVKGELKTPPADVLPPPQLPLEASAA